MSRCFPFQSTGKSNDALIVSIKLQEEKQISIPDRVIEKVKSSDKKKDRKTEKKEKKKDRKDKKRAEKEKIHSIAESDKQKPHSDKLFKVDGLLNESKGKQSIETPLERSNLTEEHGRPVDTHNVSCSSDSTGNSSKRKRNSSPANSIQGNGNIIRIRLSSYQKKDGPSASQVLQRPSISQADVMPKVQEPVRAPLTSNVAPQLVCREDKVLNFPGKIELQAPREVPSTSGRVEFKEPAKKLSSHERKMLKKESLYNKLFQNLAPPTLITELGVDQDEEEDWLFSNKDEQRPPKKLRESDDLPCSASAVLQPHAHFLSDVGVYALPFTVPF